MRHSRFFIYSSIKSRARRNDWTKVNRGELSSDYLIVIFNDKILIQVLKVFLSQSQ